MTFMAPDAGIATTQGTTTLADVLHPIEVSHFLKTVQGSDFAYLRGEPDRFSHLLPWETINRIVEQQRLAYPRLRLFMGGTRVPVQSYCREMKDGGTTRLSVIGSEVTRALRQGATLVIDSVEEMHEPLREFAGDAEYHLRDSLQINAYASCGTTNGFDLHYDDHDVLVIQVAGSKHWTVYRPTRRYPLPGESAFSKPPEDEPIFDQVLTAGDVLYMPRGWWHVVVPRNEASLHLTCSSMPRPAAHLLGWLGQRSRASERWRADLPLHRTAEEREAYLAGLREDLIAWLHEGIIDEFFDDLAASAPVRTRLGLPWMLESNPLSAGSDFCLVQVGRPVKREQHEGDQIAVVAGGRKSAVDRRLAPLVDFILSHRQCPYDSLIQHAAAHGVREPETRELLVALVTDGIVTIAT